MKNLIKKIFPPKFRRKVLDTLNHIWCFFCSHLPLQNRVLFFTVRANGKLLDNAKAVYDSYDGKKIIFAHMLPHSVKIKPLAYYYLLTSKVIVTDDYLKYIRTAELRKNQKLFQIWHACGAFKKFGLDAPSPITRKEEIATHARYDAVAVTAEHCKQFYASAFGINEEKCLAIGLPRTDALFTDKEKMREMIFKKHPRLKGKKIYLYCPTFREKNGKRIKFNTAINWDKLSKSLDKDEVFIIRRHPVMKYRLFEGKFNNIIDMSDDSTLALTAVCDVIITDYSSVIYDACLMNVPTVFYCPDLEEYERGFYLNFPEDLPGELVSDSDELLEEIRRTKENPPTEKIEKFTKKQLEMCDGKATERAVKIIKNWME